ncbi:unnamed protein product [Caenorhabditis bovis]|uniref:Exosome complex component 10 homolog n=1 Tax=Caenorhabditis bovis TaxID=2654633 RepID=A0A8S1FED9_9PELO|nr:unnamed protein product [Caenorhabditis bovis]
MAEKEKSTKESLSATAELRAQVEEAMKHGAGLVRQTNGLPKQGGDFTLYNSFPEFNSCMRKQEERVNRLMDRLTKSIGVAMRVPSVGASTQEYTECVIEAQDNIVERASTLLEVLRKADRDEIVKVPEFILKAAPTNNKVESQLSSAIRTFSANIGSLLAQKFQERKEEAAQMIVHEKPQKTYDIVVDNSEAPFISKLREKHNAIERKPGIVIVDEDESGKQEWADNTDDVEVEHPYSLELLNFKPPANQRASKEPIKFKPIKDTPLTMVDTLEKLEMLRETLNEVNEFAVDVEHNSARSYLGLTCLIQISTRNEDFIVDPFPIWNEMHILNDPFTNPKILKIFHGSDSDVLWLQRDFGIHIVNLFDTYVAMKKLKYLKFSLAYLVSTIASVVLDKQYQLADWRARPLRPAMINYAREDTHYLLYCYDVLREDLLKENSNSLEAVYTESAQLCSKIYHKPVFNPKGFMTEIKFRFSLNSRQEHAMTRLYCWRDRVAREQDESPQYVLPNHMLLALSETLPNDVGGIYACCNPLPYYVKLRTGDIFKIIVEARDVKLEKRAPTSKEIDDAHESRGVLNQTMDLITALLRSKIDFSHSAFDEERGEIEVDKRVESSDVIKKSIKDSLLNVLRPPQAINIEDEIVEVEMEKKAFTDKCQSILKTLEEWATPYECYTIAMKEKEKKEEEERLEAERRKAEEAASNEPKKFFSHNDPTICRKPVFDDNITNADELKLISGGNDSNEEEKNEELPVFDESRFDEAQLLSKKALRRKLKQARRNADISTVLGETPSTSTPSDEPRKKRNTVDGVEEFNYETEDISQFEKPVKDKNADFDPFHQKFRLKNKGKKQMMRKSANRQGTINYKKQ